MEDFVSTISRFFSWILSIFSCLSCYSPKRKRIEDSAPGRLSNDRLLQGRGEITPYVNPAFKESKDKRVEFGLNPGYFNIAVTGVGGSGKSSLIDAVRGITKGSEGSTNSGMDSQTNSSKPALRRFPDTNTSNYSRGRIVWHEYPAWSNPGVPGSAYFTEQGLNRFDLIIILVDIRFTEYDVGIIQQCILQQPPIPFLIVRSKADQHIRNIRRGMQDDDVDDDEEEEDETNVRNTLELDAQARNTFISDTRKNFRENLEKAGVISFPDAYLVSSSVLRQLVRKKDGGAVDVSIDDQRLLDDLRKLSDEKLNTPNAQSSDLNV